MNWNTVLEFLANWNNVLDLLSHLESVLLRLTCLILLGVVLVHIIGEALK